ncbi:MAG TPA: hypothetical protein VFD07_12070 [Candidatus Krumholzibacteria bacterium]|nr:hypothetical protein [Candidatus Krumholzibacteria bacterium]
MQEQVLATIESEKLAIYVVWEPILRTDNARASRKATMLVPDARARHYWIDTEALGELFQPALGLTTEPAWDVYLVYPPGGTWSDVPPAPEFFMHQLVGRLPEERLLDGEALAQRIRQLLQ